MWMCPRFKASHLPVVKYCLAKHIPVTARWQNPGRLTGMVLIKNISAEQAQNPDKTLTRATGSRKALKPFARKHSWQDSEKLIKISVHDFA